MVARQGQRTINHKTWREWSLVTDGRDVMTSDDYDPSVVLGRRVLGECGRCESIVLAPDVTGTNFGRLDPLLCSACAAIRGDSEDETEGYKRRRRQKATLRRGFAPPAPDTDAEFLPVTQRGLPNEAPDHRDGRFGGFDIGPATARGYTVPAWRRETGRASARPRTVRDSTADAALARADRAMARRQARKALTVEDVTGRRTRLISAADQDVTDEVRALKLANARHEYELALRAEQRRAAKRRNRH